MSIRALQDRLPRKMDGIGEVSQVLGVLLVSIALFTFAWARLTAGSRAPSPPNTSGERRLGAYVLGERIGRGATGEVYRARHALLGTAAAIKVLSPAFSAEDHERFEREARLMATVHHRGIPAVYDYGRTEDGTSFYVMELVEGETLGDVVEREGRLSAQRAARILVEVCAGLRAAHESGIVHGDIKPDNIVLFRRGGCDRIKIVDFGLARAIGATDGDESSDVVAGTPSYMPPEAVLAPDLADPRSDLYAVGALAYCLLTGRPPFRGDSVVEVLSQQLYAAPEPLRGKARSIPAELEQIVLDCLAKEPGDRPASAAALVDRLERFIGRGAPRHTRVRSVANRCSPGLIPVDVWA